MSLLSVKLWLSVAFFFNNYVALMIAYLIWNGMVNYSERLHHKWILNFFFSNELGNTDLAWFQNNYFIF
jgi:hypothetical protein